jgi:hypothetical protein
MICEQCGMITEYYENPIECNDVIFCTKECHENYTSIDHNYKKTKSPTIREIQETCFRNYIKNFTVEEFIQLKNSIHI